MLIRPIRPIRPARPVPPTATPGPARAGGAVYEVTLVGDLAPALVHALGPRVRATRRDECLLLTGAPTGPDELVRLLRTLAAHGCEVWQVTACVTGRGPTSRCSPARGSTVGGSTVGGSTSRGACERHQPAQQGGDHQDAAEEDQP